MQIENLEKVEKNDKVFFKVKAGGKSFTAFSGTEAYQQLMDKHFKMGDDVTLDFTTTPGTYQGKAVEYRNLVKITKPDSKLDLNTAAVEKSAEKVDWDGKERRMIRMNSLRNAIAYFEMNEPRMKEQFPGIISEQAVIGLAKKFEEHIYARPEKEGAVDG